MMLLVSYFDVDFDVSFDDTFPRLVAPHPQDCILWPPLAHCRSIGNSNKTKTPNRRHVYVHMSWLPTNRQSKASCCWKTTRMMAVVVVVPHTDEIIRLEWVRVEPERDSMLRRDDNDVVVDHPYVYHQI